MKNTATIALCLLLMIPASALHACTAVMLRAKDGSAVLARTQEWGAFDLDSEITVVPRQTSFTGTTPDKRPGLKWKVKFGYVGIVGLTEKVMIDGMNEKGLACAVLYLPGYAKFPKYDPAKAASTIAAHDLPHWILSQLTTVDEVKQKLPAVNVAPVKVKGLGNIVPPIHFMITDRSGQTIVVEYTKGTLHIYDNPVGVMTNAPEFPWHLTNLNNYLGLTPGARSNMQVGELKLSPFGVGTGMLGLPGDYTPPSRFVRAVALRNTVRPLSNGADASFEALRILNNFDIPSGAEMSRDELPTDDAVGATQWTTAMDTKNLKYYYKTMFNSRLRCIDFSKIDFAVPGIKYRPLDVKKEQDIEFVEIK